MGRESGSDRTRSTFENKKKRNKVLDKRIYKIAKYKVTRQKAFRAVGNI